MKKTLKKVLVLMLCLQFSLSVIPVNAVTTDNVSFVTDLSSVANLSADVADKNKNIVLNFTPSKNEGAGNVNFITNAGNYVLLDEYSNLFNGNYDEAHTNVINVKYVDASGNLTGNYMDILFTLPGVATINNFLLSSSNSTNIALQICEYEIYASNDRSTLFTTASKIYKYEKNKNTSSADQYYTFSTPLTARYFAIRILKGYDESDSGNAAYSYSRLRELALFGKIKYDNEYVITNDNFAKECVAQLSTAYNLVSNDFATSNKLQPNAGEISIRGCFEGVVGDSAGSCNSYYSNNDLFDYNTDMHSDISVSADGKRITYWYKNGSQASLRENTYTDIIVALKHKATIDKIFISLPKNEGLRASKYSIYCSESLETLTTDEPDFSFTNATNKKEQTFLFDTPKNAQYVCLRIFEGVTLGKYNSGVNSSYARISEIGIFGKYQDCAYYDYTVSSNLGNLISGGENCYEGKELTFTAPLSKNGYAFTGWTINGEPKNAIINRHDNQTTLNLTLSEKAEIVANYINDPETLSSAKYGVDNSSKLVRVEKGNIAFSLRNGFQNYCDTLKVLSANAEVDDSTVLKDDMVLQLTASGEVVANYGIVYEGDFNHNGSTDVTDIVSTVDAIVSGGATSENVFCTDLNNDKKLTVTDVVNIRKLVLFSDYIEDYSTTSYTINQVPYKYMGREHLTTIGSEQALGVEMTASGIIFTANCYGDVLLDAKMAQSGNNWYTVVVDGVASDVAIVDTTRRYATIARGLPAGNHTIEIYRQKESNYLDYFYGIKINGIVGDKPQDKDLLIEFVGDSITCGMGNLSKKGTTASGRHQNGYLAYGTVTARKLNADWSNISKSGASLVKDNVITTRGHMPTKYKHISWSVDDIYQHQRKSDIVVVNLGTNDNSVLNSITPSLDENGKKQRLYNDAAAFVEQIIEANGDNVKIVFAFGLMTGSNNWMNNVYSQLASDLTESGKNVYFCLLPINNDGGSNHPNVAGDEAAATVLAEFIKTNVIK